MATLIWGGAALALVGVVGLLWCVRLALRVKSMAQDTEASRAALQKVVVWNMAALGIAFVGLMMVVVGIILR
ncbi:MAG: hypothetical protein ABIV25_13495 [Paracoccaceae bacterium]